MPGSVATLATCSGTLSSISRISASSAKITPGTRIAPVCGSIHSQSLTRCKRPGSIALRAHTSTTHCATHVPSSRGTTDNAV